MCQALFQVFYEDEHIESSQQPPEVARPLSRLTDEEPEAQRG